MSDQDLPEIEAPILESPSTGDVKVMEGLLGDDSVAQMMSKLATLESLFNLVTRNCTYEEFMRELLLAVMRIIKSEAGSIFEVDHRNNTLFFRSIVGQSSDRLGKFVIPMGQGIVGYVAESKQPLVVNNVSENKVHLKAIQNAVGFEARNIIALPILVRGRIFGVLELLNRVGEDNYTPGDLDLLNYLCDRISKAIEIRLMFAWAQRANTTKKEAA